MASQYTQKASEAKPTIWVQSINGEVVTHEQTQEERQAIVIPPKGEYRLRLVAFAEPFEMPRAEKYGGGQQTMTRLLCEVASGPGQGKQTTLLCSFTFGPRSNIGKVYSATTRKSIEIGMECDPVDMLNKEFMAYLQPADKLNSDGRPVGTNCSWDTVSAVGDDLAATGTDDTWA